ncbi:MAG: Hpt domain-containing protein [Rhodobacteraceae bacterium]|nr:Hpt domain-containing protein [Paracoccaceae bacterium]
MIQWDRVAELREEVGSEDFDEVVEIFLEEVDEVTDRLRTSPDLQSLEQDLHFLKGSALNLGFHAFSELCQDGEQMSALGQAHDVDLTAIILQYEKSRSVFLSELSTRFANDARMSA